MSDLVERCYLINKRGLWYRPNSQGYTSTAIEAGRYTKEEVESITHPNGIDGPRDGMFYVHIDDVNCPNFAAHRARITALEAEVARLRVWQEVARRLMEARSYDEYQREVAILKLENEDG